MSNALIDPRPIEPNWAYEVEAPDLVCWTIRRRKWNRQAQNMDLLTEKGSGGTAHFLDAVAAILNSADFECEIDVDASQSIGEETARPRHYDLNYPTGYDLCLDWSIIGEIDSEEVGSCTDELMGWVEHCVDSHKTFTVSLWVADPTP
jgi:hypothetical protein